MFDYSFLNNPNNVYKYDSSAGPMSLGAAGLLGAGAVGYAYAWNKKDLLNKSVLAFRAERSVPALSILSKAKTDIFDTGNFYRKPYSKTGVNVRWFASGERSAVNVIGFSGSSFRNPNGANLYAGELAKQANAINNAISGSGNVLDEALYNHSSIPFKYSKDEARALGQEFSLSRHYKRMGEWKESSNPLMSLDIESLYNYNTNSWVPFTIETKSVRSNIVTLNGELDVISQNKTMFFSDELHGSLSRIKSIRSQTRNAKNVNKAFLESFSDNEYGALSRIAGFADMDVNNISAFNYMPDNTLLTDERMLNQLKRKKFNNSNEWDAFIDKVLRGAGNLEKINILLSENKKFVDTGNMRIYAKDQAIEYTERFMNDMNKFVTEQNGSVVGHNVGASDVNTLLNFGVKDAGVRAKLRDNIREKTIDLYTIVRAASKDSGGINSAKDVLGLYHNPKDQTLTGVAETLLKADARLKDLLPHAHDGMVDAEIALRVLNAVRDNIPSDMSNNFSNVSGNKYFYAVDSHLIETHGASDLSGVIPKYGNKYAAQRGYVYKIEASIDKEVGQQINEKMLVRAKFTSTTGRETYSWFKSVDDLSETLSSKFTEIKTYNSGNDTVGQVLFRHNAVKRQIIKERVKRNIEELKYSRSLNIADEISELDTKSSVLLGYDKQISIRQKNIDDAISRKHTSASSKSERAVLEKYIENEKENKNLLIQEKKLTRRGLISDIRDKYKIQPHTYKFINEFETNAVEKALNNRELPIVMEKVQRLTDYKLHDAAVDKISTAFGIGQNSANIAKIKDYLEYYKNATSKGYTAIDPFKTLAGNKASDSFMRTFFGTYGASVELLLQEMETGSLKHLTPMQKEMTIAALFNTGSKKFAMNTFESILEKQNSVTGAFKILERQAEDVERVIDIPRDVAARYGLYDRSGNYLNKIRMGNISDTSSDLARVISKYKEHIGEEDMTKAFWSAATPHDGHSLLKDILGENNFAKLMDDKRMKNFTNVRKGLHEYIAKLMHKADITTSPIKQLQPELVPEVAKRLDKASIVEEARAISKRFEVIGSTEDLAKLIKVHSYSEYKGTMDSFRDLYNGKDPSKDLANTVEEMMAIYEKTLGANVNVRVAEAPHGQMIQLGIMHDTSNAAKEKFAAGKFGDEFSIINMPVPTQGSMAVGDRSVSHKYFKGVQGEDGERILATLPDGTAISPMPNLNKRGKTLYNVSDVTASHMTEQKFLGELVNAQKAMREAKIANDMQAMKKAQKHFEYVLSRRQNQVLSLLGDLKDDTWLKAVGISKDSSMHQTGSYVNELMSAKFINPDIKDAYGEKKLAGIADEVTDWILKSNLGMVGSRGEWAAKGEFSTFNIPSLWAFGMHGAMDRPRNVQRLANTVLGVKDSVEDWRLAPLVDTEVSRDLDERIAERLSNDSQKISFRPNVAGTTYKTHSIPMQGVMTRIDKPTYDAAVEKFGKENVPVSLSNLESRMLVSEKALMHYDIMHDVTHDVAQVSVDMIGKQVKHGDIIGLDKHGKEVAYINSHGKLGDKMNGGKGTVIKGITELPGGGYRLTFSEAVGREGLNGTKLSVASEFGTATIVSQEMMDFMTGKEGMDFAINPGVFGERGEIGAMLEGRFSHATMMLRKHSGSNTEESRLIIKEAKEALHLLGAKDVDNIGIHTTVEAPYKAFTPEQLSDVTSKLNDLGIFKTYKNKLTGSDQMDISFDVSVVSHASATRQNQHITVQEEGAWKGLSISQREMRMFLNNGMNHTVMEILKHADKRKIDESRDLKEAIVKNADLLDKSFTPENALKLSDFSRIERHPEGGYELSGLKDTIVKPLMESGGYVELPKTAYVRINDSEIAGVNHLYIPKIHATEEGGKVFNEYIGILENVQKMSDAVAKGEDISQYQHTTTGVAGRLYNTMSENYAGKGSTVTRATKINISQSAYLKSAPSVTGEMDTVYIHEDQAKAIWGEESEAFKKISAGEDYYSIVKRYPDRAMKSNIAVKVRIGNVGPQELALPGGIAATLGDDHDGDTLGLFDTHERGNAESMEKTQAEYKALAERQEKYIKSLHKYKQESRMGEEAIKEAMKHEDINTLADRLVKERPDYMKLIAGEKFNREDVLDMAKELTGSKSGTKSITGEFSNFSDAVRDMGIEHYGIGNRHELEAVDAFSAALYQSTLSMKTSKGIERSGSVLDAINNKNAEEFREVMTKTGAMDKFKKVAGEFFVETEGTTSHDVEAYGESVINTVFNMLNKRKGSVRDYQKTAAYQAVYKESTNLTNEEIINMARDGEDAASVGTALRKAVLGENPDMAKVTDDIATKISSNAERRGGLKGAAIASAVLLGTYAVSKLAQGAPTAPPRQSPEHMYGSFDGGTSLAPQTSYELMNIEVSGKHHSTRGVDKLIGNAVQSSVPIRMSGALNIVEDLSNLKEHATKWMMEALR